MRLSTLLHQLCPFPIIADNINTACRLSQYQGLTYLDVDNAIPVPETVPGGSPTGTTSALEFLADAATAARTSPPEPVQQSSVTEPRSRVRSGDLRPDHAAASPASAGTAAAVTSALAGLTELDERAKDEACTPAGAAQALARVACRLYELADTLGGEARTNSKHCMSK